MSKILVPFHITDYAGSPGSVQPGFKKFYLKNGYFKLFDGAAVSDVVLDRPLDGFVPLIGTITPSDTVLTAIEKLQYIITSIGAGMVGPGTPNRVTKFVTPSTIGDSIIEDNGVSVIINRTSSAISMYTLDVNGTIYCDFGARNVINVPSAININMPYYNLPGGVPDASIININGKGPLSNGTMTGYLVNVNGPENAAFFADLQDSSLTSRGMEISSHLLHTGYYIRLKKEIAPTVYNDVFTVSHLGDTTAKSFIKIGGTSVQYLMADGSVSTGPSLTGYVPTSRTLTINGTTYDLAADRSWTIPTFASPLTTKGDLFTFSTIDARLGVGTDGQILTANSSVPEGLSWQENYADWTSVVKHIVKNNGLAGTITKGTAVYVTGSNGTNMLVGRASNTSEATSSKTMGLMQTNITTTGATQTGFVITEGLITGLNTAGLTAGDPVWLGVNGLLIYGLINKPYAPDHLVFIGIVTKVSAGTGEIFVKVQNGFELKEIHDVDLITTTPINGDLLGFDGTLWVNKTIAGWLGYTPANASGTTNYVSKFTGTNTLGVSQIYDDGNNIGVGTNTPIAKIHIVGNTGLAFSTNTLNWGMAYIKTVVMDPLMAPYEGDLTFSAPYWDGSLYSFPERVRIAAHTGYFGINQTIPTQHLHVEGNTRITGAIYDSLNLPGTNGQILSSTAVGSNWISSSDLIYNKFADRQLTWMVPADGSAVYQSNRVGGTTSTLSAAAASENPQTIIYNSGTVVGALAYQRGNPFTWTIGSAASFELNRRFRITSNIGVSRFFCGMSSLWTSAGTPTNVEPDTLLRSIGVAKMSYSNNMFIIYNDNTGLAGTFDCGVNFPASSVGGYTYRVKISKVAGIANITITLYRYDSTGAFITTSTTIASTDYDTSVSYATAMWITNNSTPTGAIVKDYAIIFEKS